MEDEGRKAAVAAIKQKYDKLLTEHLEIATQIGKLKKRDLELLQNLEDCQAAARLFGAEDEIMSAHPAPTLVERGGRAVEIPLYGRVGNAPRKRGGRRVRDIVLERLEAAGTEGTKAAPIREHVEAAVGQKIHEKTVGMTLYRLAQDGLAKREGLKWFFVPPSAETKNPGAEDTGAS